MYDSAVMDIKNRQNLFFLPLKPIKTLQPLDVGFSISILRSYLSLCQNISLSRSIDVAWGQSSIFTFLSSANCRLKVFHLSRSCHSRKNNFFSLFSLEDEIGSFFEVTSIIILVQLYHPISALFPAHALSHAANFYPPLFDVWPCK